MSVNKVILVTKYSNPDNLQLMTRSKHASHHAKENIINRSRTDKGRLK